ncbi:MAG: alanine--tRNA ligase, partial [Candidatus Moraniibacteriota bacterium]
AHLTFFEMLGNWSLGDYFKKESIQWSWEFLTDPHWLGLDPKMISVTVFEGDENAPRDEESAEIWRSLDMPAERIAYLPAEDNWWAAGPTGPCGPDTEIFYWVGEGKPQGNKKSHSKEWMEIWNNVFMQYNRVDENTLEKLPAPCVDTGMGLERAIVALNGLKNVYQTDAFANVLEEIRKRVGEKYSERSARIIADHLRAAMHMIADGVIPKNVEQGYILRRLIRRSIREFSRMGYEEPVVANIAALFIEKFKDVYDSVRTNKERILEELKKEEGKFHETLERGLNRLEKFLSNPEGNYWIKQVGDELQKANLYPNDEVTDVIFDLYQTYGFPLELVFEELRRRGIDYDEEKLTQKFNERFEKHQNLSRTASAGKFKGGLADTSEKTTMLHTTTHLMLAGLRKYLGPQVHQAGSNITEERTRFDFTYPQKVDSEILRQVESYVNEAIQKGCAVSIEVMEKDKAKEAGVEGSFWEKYPEKVNVYQVKAADGTIYSQELCGGPHVANTGVIRGTFKIIKEEASSAGVRRIKAILE